MTLRRPLGVLQLKTNFPRPPGDVSNPSSWDGIPIKVAVVGEANAKNVVGGTWGEDLVMCFVREGRRLIEEEGCVALVTSCGFLATMHPLLSTHLPSIGTSSLLQLPLLSALYPIPNSVGVITFRESALSIKHFMSVGANPKTPFTGLPPGGVFDRVLNEGLAYDWDGMCAEVIKAGEDLRDLCRMRGGHLMAICLECTNMPPFSLHLARHLNVRVFDILTLGKMIHSSASMADYSPHTPSLSPPHPPHPPVPQVPQ